MRTSARLAWMLGFVTLAGATGCFLSSSEDASSADAVKTGATPAQLLRSTLVLEPGCVAAKVGPRHLLASARCVASVREAFADGSTIGFTTADSVHAATSDPDMLAETDAGVAEGSADAAPDGQAPKKDAGASGARTVTIASLHIHPSFEAKCVARCTLGDISASDAPDVAVLVLDADLDTIPTIPVDLDAVGQSDPLFILTSGCEKLAGTGTGTIDAVRTIAVPPKSVNHDGSPYVSQPQYVSRLAASYFVSPGPAWKSALKLCASDIGGPVFRAGATAVSGITSSYTTWGENAKSPVTLEHTRLDAQSRFKIGPWLSELGVSTVHSCSGGSGGCQKRAYDGGMPKTVHATEDDGTTTASDSDSGIEADGGTLATDGDGGESADAGASTTYAPPEPGETQGFTDQGPPDPPSYGEEDYGDAALPSKKSPASGGGCTTSAAPMGGGETGALVGLGVAVVAMSRRKRSVPRNAR